MTKKSRNSSSGKLNSDIDRRIDRAVDILARGGLVVMPTDTVYGIAADPAVPGALERIYQIKNREKGKPVPLLAADICDVELYGALISPAVMKLAGAFWPGPLTIVIDVNGEKEGFRVPAHDIALSILKAAGGVLRVTSANLSGESPALTAGEAVQYLGDSVDFVIDAGRSPGGVPSTVVEIADPADAGSQTGFTILREGDISRDQLMDILMSV